MEKADAWRRNCRPDLSADCDTDRAFRLGQSSAFPACRFSLRRSFRMRSAFSEHPVTRVDGQIRSPARRKALYAELSGSVPDEGSRTFRGFCLARPICGFCRSFFPEDHLSFLRAYREKRSCGLLDKDGKLSGDRPDFSCYTFSARQRRLPWRKFFFI